MFVVCMRPISRRTDPELYRASCFATLEEALLIKTNWVGRTERLWRVFEVRVYAVKDDAYAMSVASRLGTNTRMWSQSAVSVVDVLLALNALDRVDDTCEDVVRYVLITPPELGEPPHAFDDLSTAVDTLHELVRSARARARARVRGTSGASSASLTDPLEPQPQPQDKDDAVAAAVDAGPWGVFDRLLDMLIFDLKA